MTDQTATPPPLGGSPIEPEEAPRQSLAGRLRNYFLTGLVVAGPVAITIYLTWSFVTWVDDLVRPLVICPTRFRVRALWSRSSRSRCSGSSPRT